MKPRAADVSTELIPGEPVELRMLVPAGMAWLAAAIALMMSAAVGLIAAAVLVVVGAAVGATMLRGRRPRHHVRRRVVAAALLCAAGAAAAAAWRVAAVQRGPLPSLARSHATVTLELIVTSDPHLSAASSTGSSRSLVVLLAKAVEVSSDAVPSTRISSPIVVLATAPGWLSLQPTQRVTAVGRVSIPDPGELDTALFDARGSPTQVGAASPIERVAGRIRDGLRTAASPLPSGPRGLLPGLVDGDTSGLSPDLVAAFRTTGLTHIVAVSGANVAIVLGAALVIARRMRAGLRAQALIGVLTIVGFVIVARPQASVLRAAAMGLVAVLALATGRRRRALPALCAAVLFLIYIDPTLARSVGFALSVVATGALLVLAPPLRRWMARRLPGFLADALAVPTAATLACAPLIASISGQISLASIPANLLAEPAVAPATILGVLAAALAPVSMGAAQLIARLAGIPCWWLVLIARTFSRLPGAAVPWRDGAAGALALLVLGSAIGVLLWSARWRGVMLRVVVVATLVASALAVRGRLATQPWPPSDWVLAACDVGQGEAIVARTGAQSGVLVDAGPSPPAVDGCLDALGIRTLDWIVLTGGSSAAIAGVPGVLHDRAVGALDAGLGLAADAEVRVRGWASASHVTVATAAEGQVHTVGALRWSVVAELDSGRVVRLVLPGLTVLIAGDTDAADLTDISSRARLAADVLVVPRHGGDMADDGFLHAVRPAVAVVSVGLGNTQHEPSPRVLGVLATIAGRVVRTDRDGDIAISVHVGGLRVMTPRGSHEVSRPVASGFVVAPPAAWMPETLCRPRMACCLSCLLTAVPARSPWSLATRSSSSNARSPPWSPPSGLSTKTRTCVTSRAPHLSRANWPS
ncbi:MAG TPA: ComEC/Rec2 family competence protein [Acidothermaceae bacterium]|nr:ComEC/Rec2 family competence protein [Acidothermaceae bacterium]